MADSRHITNHGTADIVALLPLGIPAGMDPRAWRQAIEARLNELLDQSMSLITALDMMEADHDLEDGGDLEPSLGWTDRGPAALAKDCQQDDREDQCDDEGAEDSDIEPNGDETDYDGGECDCDIFIWGGGEDGKKPDLPGYR